jgi:dTDP-4-amino-4,6-dideoxygalactose transaminase
MREPVPFLDLRAQHQPLREEILAVWEQILDDTRFVSGAEVAALEEAFGALHDVDHCIAVSNGTEALVLSLRALGVGPGDEVVVPANTFVATAEAVSLVGASPRFVDCDPVTKNLDTAAAIDALEEPAVRGVIGVHLYGQPAEFDTLVAAATSSGRWAMEDAAQAHGASYHGRPVGGLGRIAGFSFYPGKNLGAPGEGGAVTTNDDELARTVRLLRDHGQSAKYHSEVIGTNARMSELVAAVLNIKLRYLVGWSESRRAAAAMYHERLADLVEVELPAETDRARSVYHLYVIHVPERDRIRQLLGEAGVGTGLHYPVPVHLQPAYAGLGHEPGSFPNAERSAATLLSLPMFPELTESQIDRVCDTLRAAVHTTLRRAGRSA